MERRRLALGCVAGTLAAAALTWACIPDPDGDLKDFQERIVGFDSGKVIEASAAETAAPPQVAEEGLYYGACLSELGLGNPKLVFNFLTATKYTPEPEGTPGARFEFKITVLAVVNSAPPPNVVAANVVGLPLVSPALTAANVDTGTSRFGLDLQTLNADTTLNPLVIVDGKGNPISGSQVEIAGARLEGLFQAANADGRKTFCARLGGQVNRPISAQRQLDPSKNICRFVEIKEGEATPVFTIADYQATSCPL